MLSQAETVFEALGIDSAVAVRMFIRRVVAARGLPFSMKMDEPEFTPGQESRILAAIEESKDPANVSKPYEDVAEMFRDMRRETAKEKPSRRRVPP